MFAGREARILITFFLKKWAKRLPKANCKFHIKMEIFKSQYSLKDSIPYEINSLNISELFSNSLLQNDTSLHGIYQKFCHVLIVWYIRTLR